jgi:hypothetical protein
MISPFCVVVALNTFRLADTKGPCYSEPGNTMNAAAPGMIQHPGCLMLSSVDDAARVWFRSNHRGYGSNAIDSRA